MVQELPEVAACKMTEFNAMPMKFLDIRDLDRRAIEIVENADFDANTNEHQRSRLEQKVQMIHKKSISFLEMKCKLVNERNMVPLDADFKELLCQNCYQAIPYIQTGLHRCERKEPNLENVNRSIEKLIVGLNERPEGRKVEGEQVLELAFDLF